MKKKTKQNKTKRNKTVCRFDKLVEYIYIHITHLLYARDNNNNYCKWYLLYYILLYIIIIA